MSDSTYVGVNNRGGSLGKRCKKCKHRVGRHKTITRGIDRTFDGYCTIVSCICLFPREYLELEEDLGHEEK